MVFSFFFGISIDNAPIKVVFFINFFNNSLSCSCGSFILEDSRSIIWATPLISLFIGTVSKSNLDMRIRLLSRPRVRNSRVSKYLSESWSARVHIPFGD